MKNLALAILMFCALNISAQITEVSGNQCGTWSGEVHLTGDVTVPRDEVLAIEAGTSVIADGYFGISVLGGIVAEGTEDAMITFTVADTTGYADYDNPELGGWKGFLLTKPGQVRFSHCEFSYGKTQLDSDGGAMRIYMARDVEMANCKFHHNTMRRRGGAIYAENSTLNIHDCEVCDNQGFGFEGSYIWGVGFQFLKCDVNMHDMVFHDNYSPSAYGGGMNIDSCNLELRNAVFYNNRAVNAGGLGIQRCKGYDVKVANMLAYDNVVMHYGGGLAMATSDPELNNITVVNNYCGGGGGAGMQMAFNSCPTLNNCIFWGNHAIASIETDTVEYYLGSQIWLWGDDNDPFFYNGTVQYGLDTINVHGTVDEDHYIDMIKDNPLFVNEKARDYKLLANSPCIDKGLEDISGLFIPETDLAGGQRVYNSRIDMGCYEWNNIGVNEVPEGRGGIVVYPNPLNGNAYCVIKMSKKSDAVMRLISLDGKEVYRESCGTLNVGENVIPLDGIVRNLKKADKIYLLMIDNQYVKIIY